MEHSNDATGPAAGGGPLEAIADVIEDLHKLEHRLDEICGLIEAARAEA